MADAIKERARKVCRARCHSEEHHEQPNDRASCDQFYCVCTAVAAEMQWAATEGLRVAAQTILQSIAVAEAAVR